MLLYAYDLKELKCTIIYFLACWVQEYELRGHRYKSRKQKTRSKGYIQVDGRVTIPRLDTGVEVSMVKYLLFVLSIWTQQFIFWSAKYRKWAKEGIGIRQESQRQDWKDMFR